MNVRPLREKKIDYYKSIDELPIFNWFKIQSSNDIRWLCKDKPDNLSVRQVGELEGQFNVITGEYIDTFGISEEFRKVLDIRWELGGHKLNLAFTGDRFIQNYIDMCEAELKELTENKDTSNSNTKVKAYIEEMMHFHLDEKKITVKEYYTYVQMLKEKATQTPVSHGKENT